MDRWDFYKFNFLKNIPKNSNILIISASEKEINLLNKLGYSNLSITFHDKNDEKKLQDKGFILNKNLFKADLRELKFTNQSFDYVATNATIHHVDLPHKAITEMYRISKKGVLIIESNDSLIIRLACKLNLAEEYEISSINKNLKSGGLLDTGIPNYVYRWTEREIKKTLQSYDPQKINLIKFEYTNDLNNIKDKRNIILDLLLKISKFLIKFLFVIFKNNRIVYQFI